MDMPAAAPLLVPSFRLSDTEVGSAKAFEAFARATQDLFAIATPTPDDIETFTIEMTAWHLGPVMFGSIRASPLDFHRSVETVVRSGMDHLLVQLYDEGGFAGVAGHDEIVVQPGDICVFDLTATLKTRASAFHNLTLLVPRTMLGGLADTVAPLNGLVLPRTKPLTSMLAAHLQTLTSRIAEMNATEANAVARGTVALINSVISAVASPRAGRGADPIDSLFRTIAQHIDANLAAPTLNAATIAAGFGLSRASLYRLFQPVGGVAEYVRNRRLTGAALAIVSGEHARRTVAQVAFHFGFPNEAAFRRNFKALFGMSPSEARDRADRVWPATSWDETNGVDAQRFAHWMKTLRSERPDRA